MIRVARKKQVSLNPFLGGVHVWVQAETELGGVLFLQGT